MKTNNNCSQGWFLDFYLVPSKLWLYKRLFTCPMFHKLCLGPRSLDRVYFVAITVRKLKNLLYKFISPCNVKACVRPAPLQKAAPRRIWGTYGARRPRALEYALLIPLYFECARRSTRTGAPLRHSSGGARPQATQRHPQWRMASTNLHHQGRCCCRPASAEPFHRLTTEIINGHLLAVFFMA